MTTRPLPDGDTEKTTYGTSMGALWRDDANERLVQFNNYEDYDDYEVRVYRLVDGEVERETQYWDDETIEAFTDPENETTAYLSGHNLPGVGRYGVFTAKKPNCPECGQFMSPGEPMYHGQGVQPIGLTCKEYGRSNGMHEGYMTHQEAIDKGYYIPIETYLKRRYGGDSE